jgi:uncharacterized protein (TIGR02284 family)
MESNEKVTGILNDLIQINNDRIVGYQKAIEELKEGDGDLRALFQQYIHQSQEYQAELRSLVRGLGGSPATDETTNSGKVYRVWMDLKAVFTGKDRKTILNNCEFGEDAAQKAYSIALNEDVNLDGAIRELIVKQKAALKVGHDEVKRLREMHDTTNIS